jgi:hypothetical protein
VLRYTIEPQLFDPFFIWSHWFTDKWLWKQIHEVCLQLAATKEEDDLVLSQCIAFSGVAQQAFGIITELVDPATTAWNAAIAKLRTLSICQSPLKMLYTILITAQVPLALAHTQAIISTPFFCLFQKIFDRALHCLID